MLEVYCFALVPKGYFFIWAVYSVQTDFYGSAPTHDLDRVPVAHTHHFAPGCVSGKRKQGVDRNSRTRRNRKMLCQGLVFPEHFILVI